MASLNISNEEPSSQSRQTFSLVIGGYYFRLMCVSRLCDQNLSFLKRRILALSLFAWLPLFLFSVLQGQAFTGEVIVPFIYDFEAHLRFLVSIPLLLVAELIVHLRLQPVVRDFCSRDLIPIQLRGKFQAAIISCQRLLSSFLPELCILVLVYAVGILVIWNQYISLDVATWYSTPAKESNLTLAGFWYVFVSIPIFQFLLLRWFFRVLVWWKFLWHVARIKLSLIPTHPDRMGGLGFLAQSSTAFAVLATAHMSLVAGQIANRIFYVDAKLLDFKVELAVAGGYLMVLYLLPLFFFIGQLAQAKRTGLREYGKLAHKYVRDFDTKWFRSVSGQQAELMGSADIQSLADLSNGYEPIRTMRLIPISTDVVLVLLIAMLLPIFPLLLTMMPLEELAAKLLTFLF